MMSGTRFALFYELLQYFYLSGMHDLQLLSITLRVKYLLHDLSVFAENEVR